MPMSVERTISLEKRKLRGSMQQKRMALPHASMVTSSKAIARHFADHPILAFMPSFAGYIAMRGEVDIMPIFELMTRYNKETALPCIVEGKNLLFRRWSKSDPLVRGPLNVQEPESTAPSVIPSLVLVPLLAFDGEGYRLGYGAGYYDRTIAAMREFPTPPLFIGVGYSMQEVDAVPTDAHDLPLDGILTELGVSMFRSVR